ncbi:MAG: hypothetical protein K0R54_5008 [Clostridiaceae bacterium]|jgi:molybdopterin converting factor small subunit|nr:hypothetical protein [Clostridiaceae bacterium]
MFEQYFKLGVGNYYFYDENDNMIGAIEEITKEIISYNSTGVGAYVNLINAVINNKLIDNFDKVKKIILRYQVCPRESEKVLYGEDNIITISELIDKFKILNYKIVSEKDQVAVMNIKLNILDKTTIINDNDII